MKWISRVVLSALSAVAIMFQAGLSYADWTPLVTSGSFTGITTDVSTAAGGIISVALIILGLGLLLRAIK